MLQGIFSGKEKKKKCFRLFTMSLSFHVAFGEKQLRKMSITYYPLQLLPMSELTPAAMHESTQYWYSPPSMSLKCANMATNAVK